jgi:hypothetical protein
MLGDSKACRVRLGPVHNARQNTGPYAAGLPGHPARGGGNTRGAECCPTPNVGRSGANPAPECTCSWLRPLEKCFLLETQQDTGHATVPELLVTIIVTRFLLTL